jgi:alpha-L-rhamnosidase
MIRITRMKTDHIENPLGIDETTPGFSWALESDQGDVRQESYRVQVSAAAIAVAPDFATPLWDSGTVHSNESIQVLYAGPSIKSRTRYWWRVKAATNRDGEGDWSQAAWFETGLLSTKDWQARFISAET